MTATVGAPRAAVGVAVAGCALLVLRPLLLATGTPATPTLLALFVALLAVGALWRDVGPTRRRRVLGTLALGVVAFGAARVVGGGQAPHAAVVRLILLNTLAAVAEEAFFRRFLYRLLERNGTAVAIAGSATLFALVHVTVYGLWVFPIDLAAGLLFSWQRYASGSWRVPALTHVIANVLVVI